MLENFTIIHHFGPISDNGANSPPPAGWFCWKTCLRIVTLGFLDPLQEIKIDQNESEIFTGAEAYAFLLEVVCGLHSPVLGETEVMGQFKMLEEETSRSAHVYLKRVFRQILTDAKFIRQRFLRDTGSRSYGSLLRKYVREAKHISILGSGRLAQEILPWLKIAPKVNLICRNVEKGKKLIEACQFAEINDMSENHFGDVFIIAAKISTIELREFMGHRIGIAKIIDLRDISSEQPLNLPIPTLTLKQLFSEIKGSEVGIQKKIQGAKTLITELAHKCFNSAELRPFGWEDLCG
jgi:glutamyl-tRNA reductase